MCDCKIVNFSIFSENTTWSQQEVMSLFYRVGYIISPDIPCPHNAAANCKPLATTD